MKEPSLKWRRIRFAALERAQREVVQSLTTLHALHFGVCLLFLVGWVRFTLAAPSIEGVGMLEAVQIFLVATAGLLVPVFTGAVAVLAFTGYRIRRLIEE